MGEYETVQGMDYDDDEILDAVSGVDYVGEDMDEDDEVLALLGEGDDDVGALVQRGPKPMFASPSAMRRQLLSLGRRRVMARAPAAAASSDARQVLAMGEQLKAMLTRAKSAKRRKVLGRRALAGKQPTILLGIDSQTSLGRDINANETVTIATEAVDRMRIIDFQIRAAIAGDFLIGRIQVQRTNLLSGGAPVPADIFAAPDRPPLESPVLYPGTELLVEVINLVGAARRFTGQFRGIDLDRDR